MVLKILLVTASPRGPGLKTVPEQKVGATVDQVLSAVFGAEHVSQLSYLKKLQAATLNGMITELAGANPPYDVLHIQMHVVDNKLAFRDGEPPLPPTDSDLVSIHRLQNELRPMQQAAFRLSSDRAGVKCLILSGCSSQEIGHAVSDYFPFVISTANSIDIATSERFLCYFYGLAVRPGIPLEYAFSVASAQHNDDLIKRSFSFGAPPQWLPEESQFRRLINHQLYPQFPTLSRTVELDRPFDGAVISWAGGVAMMLAPSLIMRVTDASVHVAQALTREVTILSMLDDARREWQRTREEVLHSASDRSMSRFWRDIAVAKMNVMKLAFLIIPYFISIASMHYVVYYCNQTFTRFCGWVLNWVVTVH